MRNITIPDETTNSPHTPTSNPNNNDITLPSHPPSLNAKYTNEDQSSAETRVEPTGRVKIDTDTIKERIVNLIFDDVLADELRKGDTTYNKYGNIFLTKVFHGRPLPIV